MVIGAAWVGQVRRGRIELLIADRFLIRQTGLGWPSFVVRPIKSKEVMLYYFLEKELTFTEIIIFHISIITLELKMIIMKLSY